ncbi:MAG: hypothetical protein WC640_00065 [Candidatus Paceibacterota bacterium]|jgi:hypothetical protein
MSIKKALSLNANLFSHHAFLLTGDREFWRGIVEKELKIFLKLENLNSSPDILWQSYESFGIKEAHTLIEREARKGFGTQGRFFVLEISSITPEAQNALLKTFEEPAPDAHFFIIARNAEIFLPTLRSRMIILSSGAEFGQNEVGLQVSPKSNFVDADHFLKLDFPDRLDFIQKEFLKNKETNKSAIIDFVIELEKTLRDKIEIKKITKDEEFALHELEKCQRYLQNPRSSNRLILEHLALILPN